MDHILEKLDRIQHDIDTIKVQLDQIAPQTQKMDQHVDFVNTIYSNVKRPFHFICDKTSQLMGNTAQIQLPEK